MSMKAIFADGASEWVWKSGTLNLKSRCRGPLQAWPSDTTDCKAQLTEKGAFLSRLVTELTTYVPELNQGCLSLKKGG